MNKIRKLLLWFIMLSKRLYKKPTFLAVMVLIPVLVLGYVSLSGGDSGVITIGLTCYEPDPITQQIFNELESSSELLSFPIYSDPQEAQALLEGGKLDSLWIFPENMAEKIQQFAQKPTSANAFITVLVRQDNVTLMLAREKLNGAIYPYVAQRVYVHFLRDLAPELDHLTDAQLLEYYHATDLTADLFQFEGAAGQQGESSYLLSPLRGLLGSLILLCSLAAAMFYIRDSENGTFAWVSTRWRFLPELGCQLTAATNIAAICLICLGICALAGNIWLELLLVCLYSLCCSVFAMALRRICGSSKALGTILPLVIVLVLVICPIFFDLGALRQLQLLLPPTYYINAIYDSRYLLYMAGYTAALAGIAVLVNAVKSRL